MIRYVIDSSALWRILRDASLRAAWSPTISVHAIGSCHPQRVEFRRSARSLSEYDDMASMFDSLYPDVAIHKSAWRWIDSAQYQLLRQGAHRAMSAVDLMICATAAYHGMIILHDDSDFVTAAGCLADVSERSIHDLPPSDQSAP